MDEKEEKKVAGPAGTKKPASPSTGAKKAGTSSGAGSGAKKTTAVASGGGAKKPASTSGAAVKKPAEPNKTAKPPKEAAASVEPEEIAASEVAATIEQVTELKTAPEPQAKDEPLIQNFTKERITTVADTNFTEERKMNIAGTGQAAAALLPANEIQKQIKPLSNNGFAAFFQKIGRAWLSFWYGFSDKHPKGSKIIYQIGFFFAFSMAVTVWQYIIMTFMPALFGSLNQKAFVFPSDSLGNGLAIPNLFDKAGNQLYYSIFNEPAAAAGKWGGLGNFIAFEIAVFTAQCINFPLQRNITFKSHGNPLWQAMWYFIGWVLISVFVNAVWGIINPFVIAWDWPQAVTGLLKTFITGGISMIIFFPIFKIIFPDYNVVEKRSRKKLEKMKAGKTVPEKIAKQEAAVEDAAMKAKVANAEKAESVAIAQASSKAMAYFATVKGAEKAQAKAKELESSGAAGEKLEKAKQAAKEYNEKIPVRLQQASEAVAAKEAAIAEFSAVKKEAEAFKPVAA